MNTSSKSEQLHGRAQRLAGASRGLEHPAEITTARHRRLKATVLSISAVDLRLAMDGNPERGETVCVTIPAQGRIAEITLTGVVHWKEMRGGLHEVGIFLNPEAPEHALPLRNDINRGSERYSCRISGRLDWGSAGAECVATAVNYSYSGLALRCPSEGPIDEVFVFRWLDAEHKHHVTGVARWQVEQNGSFLIGCELEPGAGYRIAGLRIPGQAAN